MTAQDIAKKWEGTGSFETLYLFQILVHNGCGIKEAISEAQKGIQSDNLIVQSNALSLFETLIKNNAGIEAAIESAKKELRSNDPDSQFVGLNLFKTLLDKNLGMEDAFAFFKHEIQASTFEIKSPDFFKLFEIMIQKGLFIQSSIEFLKTQTLNTNHYVRWNTFCAFDRLLRSGYAIQEVQEEALKRMRSKDQYTRWEALCLFKLLAENKHPIPNDMQKLATEFLPSKDKQKVYVAKLLLSILEKQKDSA
jgi:hypothetical protein